MILSVTLTGDKELLNRMRALATGALRQAMLAKVKRLAIELEAHVKTRKLNGQVLNRITGALSRSISHDAAIFGSTVVARVFSSGDVKYAAIHEYGGTINHPGGTAYIINPKKEQLMMFVKNSNATSDMPRTKPHQITMPERSFLRSSLRDMSVKISKGMKEEAIASIRKTMA